MSLPRIAMAMGLALGLSGSALAKPTGHPREPIVLLSVEELVDEFRFDESLRLEVLNQAPQAQLQKLRGSEKPVRISSTAAMEMWTLPSGSADALTPAREGQWFNLVSPYLEYNAPLEGFELWFDGNCNRYFLVARFPLPTSEVAQERAYWVGAPTPLLQQVGAPDDSLASHTPPALPPEALEHLDSASFARFLGPSLGPEIAAEDLPSDLAVDIKVGTFLEIGQPSVLLTFSWTERGSGIRHVQVLLDERGNTLLEIDAAHYQAWSGDTLQSILATDLDGDGLDEIVIGLTTPGGGTRLQVWSFEARRLRERWAGSEWGCLGSPAASPTSSRLSRSDLVRGLPVRT